MSVREAAMGSVKKEIALLGDTLNTAARLVDVCRDSGESVIASADLLDRLMLPPGVASPVTGPNPAARQGTGHRALRAGPGDA
jgi:class 3 adenylate cyclase